MQFLFVSLTLQTLFNLIFETFQSIENRYDTYEGVGRIQLPLFRNVGSFGAVSVSWQASPREATNNDFSPAGGTVHFLEGQDEAVIEILIDDDSVAENLEVVTAEIL